MYRVLVTDDFVNMLCDIPLRHLSVLTHSFVSVEKVDEDTALSQNGVFILEMLEQIRNQELE